MDNDTLYLKLMFEKFKIKYNIFDDKNEFTKTSSIIGEIVITRNYDFISFCLFYFYLYDQRIMNGNDPSHPLVNNEVWPVINSSKSVIERFLKNNDETEYLRLIEYIKNDFEPKISKYSEQLSVKFKQLKAKLSSEKQILINSDYRRQISNFNDDSNFGIYLNNVAFIINKINVIKDFNIELEILVKDEKRYLFNFWLSLGLAIFSIILSIVMYFIPR